MTIFVAGVHGVGKTYLAKPAALRLGMRYATASQLIREERGYATWDSSKKVDEVSQNQAALVAAVDKINLAGHSLLLDGHFVLRTAVGSHQMLPQAVFRDLGCTSVVLLACPTEVVLERLSSRGENSWTEDEIVVFARCEADRAAAVCEALAIPLVTLREPTLDAFDSVLTALRASEMGGQRKAKN